MKLFPIPIDSEGSTGKWGLGREMKLKVYGFSTFISKVGWFNGVGLR